MNERIKELESQCWEARQYGPPWFNYKKFAELIVRECRKVIADDIDDNSDDDFDLGLDHARQIIGEHFGVEK
jgi:hypothetical protein